MSIFAVVADPHIAIPNPVTGRDIVDSDREAKLYRESVELLETAIAQINAIPDVDFVVIPGDITKDSERYNHEKARELLQRFRCPVYCIPGNHDLVRPPEVRPPQFLDPDAELVHLREFPSLYRDFGYQDTQRFFYSLDPAPDLHLIALNSSRERDDYGEIPPEELVWLEKDLQHQRGTGKEIVVVVHHSLIDHVPGEATSPLFGFFHIVNAEELKAVLRRYGVHLVFSGHLHMQDVKVENGLYNIVTSSLASYPHAYRIVTLQDGRASIRSVRIASLPMRPDLESYSREVLADTFVRTIRRTLRKPPFSRGEDVAGRVAEKLRYWWPAIASGDEVFHYTAEELGDPELPELFNAFSDGPPPDNDLTIDLTSCVAL